MAGIVQGTRSSQPRKLLHLRHQEIQVLIAILTLTPWYAESPQPCARWNKPIHQEEGQELRVRERWPDLAGIGKYPHGGQSVQQSRQLLKSKVIVRVV